MDLRRLQENTGDRAVTLEVSATGDGVIPEVRTLLAGLDGALAGYSLADADIESRPYNVVQTEGGGRLAHVLRLLRDAGEEGVSQGG